MPSYKVIKSGFFGGILYDPTGKRPVLHVDKAFTEKTMPSWVEAIDSKKEVSFLEGTPGKLSAKELKVKLKELGIAFNKNASAVQLQKVLDDHEKAISDKKDITGANALDEPETL